MNNNDYQKWAISKDRPTYQDLADRLERHKGNLRLVHGVMGIGGEAGELVDVIKKTIMYNKELDVVNVKEECGDLLWYMAIILDEIGSSFEEVMKINHDKLEKRYPTGFTEKLAQERRDKNVEVCPVVRDYKADATLYDIERKHILTTLSTYNNNKTQAANALGITIKTLYNKLHEYGEFEKFSVKS